MISQLIYEKHGLYQKKKKLINWVSSKELLLFQTHHCLMPCTHRPVGPTELWGNPQLLCVKFQAKPLPMAARAGWQPILGTGSFPKCLQRCNSLSSKCRQKATNHLCQDNLHFPNFPSTCQSTEQWFVWCELSYCIRVLWWGPYLNLFNPHIYSPHFTDEWNQNLGNCQRLYHYRKTARFRARHLVCYKKQMKVVTYK